MMERYIIQILIPVSLNWDRLATVKSIQQMIFAQLCHKIATFSMDEKFTLVSSSLLFFLYFLIVLWRTKKCLHFDYTYSNEKKREIFLQFAS